MSPDFKNKPTAIKGYKLSSPCPVTWEQMTGTDRFRICNRCEHYVYEFSNLSLNDSLQIVYKRENIADPQFFRREDGTFSSKDCSLVASRNRMYLTAGAAVGAVVLVAATLLLTSAPSKTSSAIAPVAPVNPGDAIQKGKLGTGSATSFGMVKRHRPPQIRRLNRDVTPGQATSTSSSALGGDSTASNGTESTGAAAPNVIPAQPPSRSAITGAQPSRDWQTQSRAYRSAPSAGARNPARQQNSNTNPSSEANEDNDEQSPQTTTSPEPRKSYVKSY